MGGAGGVQFDADVRGQGDVRRRTDQAAVRQVVDQGQLACFDQAAHEVAGLAFQLQVDRRRGAVFTTQNLAQIDGGAQFAVRLADQDQDIALGHAAEAGGHIVVGQQADRADGRRRRNGDAVGLVIEADVAAHDREVQLAAGLGHAVGGAHDLAHDLRALRVAEVQVVGDGDGTRTDGGQVAPRLGHGLLAAFIGVGLDIARGAVAGDGQTLFRAVDADHARVGAGRAVLQRVGHDVTVVLLPDPALRRHVGAGDDLQYGVVPAFGRRHFRRVEARLQFRLDPRAVIQGRVVEQRGQRHVADHIAVVLQHQMAGVGRLADNGEVQSPFLEDAIADIFKAGLQHGQHPLLAFRQHHLIGGHAGFALGHLVQIQLDADAALARHLDGRRGQARRAHVLNGGHGARSHQLQRGFDQQLLGEGVADLHRGALGVRLIVELGRGHGGAVDAVAAGLGAEIDHVVARFRRGRIIDFIGAGQADAHGVDQDVAVVALVEVRLARNGRHADAVAIAADAADHALDQTLRLLMRRIAEAQGVQQGHRARAHGEDVAHDAAHARRRTLIGFDVGGVVVALHLEDAGVAVVDVDHAGVLAGAADDALARHRELHQLLLGRLVGTMLGPHDREDAQLDLVGLAAQPVQQDLIFIGGEAVLFGQLGDGLLGRAHGRAF